MTPIGVPMRRATPIWIRLPTMALSRTPFSPGGSITCVKTLEPRAGRPRWISVNRIQASMKRQSRAAPVEMALTVQSLARRRARRFMLSSLDAGAHERPRDREHDEGDDEEDEAELQQRIEFERAGAGLGKFVGDGRGDGRARGEKR